MKKRFTAVMLTACMLATAVPTTGMAVDAQMSQTEQTAANIVDSGTLSVGTLTWALDADGTLTISGVDSMPADPYWPWSDRKDSIKKLVLEEGVRNITQYAFSGCVNLQEAEFPQSLTEIDEGSFESTGIADNPENTYQGAVYYQGWLLSCNTNCADTYEVKPGTVGLADEAFNGCKFQEIILPESLKSLSRRAFYNCDNLKTICLPEGINAIPKEAFFNCKALSDISVPSSVKEIGESAFEYCSSLTEIELPQGLTSIGFAAFRNSSLQHVEIPNCVTKIGDDAFRDTRLETIRIPSSVTNMGCQAFGDCRSLTTVELGANVPIARGMFNGCYNLKELDIPEGITEIPTCAFNQLRLVSISIPYSVKKIGEAAFFSCDSLKEVYYGGSEKTFNEIEVGNLNEALYNADVYVAMPFDDVSMTAYYAQPVIWAYAYEITAGIDETHFAPDQNCTRAQVVTFLWSAAGKPEVDTDATFRDVKSGSWYEKAVKWAVSEGITAGTSATTFSPDEICTRAQIVTFLWSAEGKPTVQDAMPFRDVKSGSWYEQAVRWAVSEGITAGTSATTFAPTSSCTRAQVVTFLYKDLAEE